MMMTRRKFIGLAAIGAAGLGAVSLTTELEGVSRAGVAAAVDEGHNGSGLDREALSILAYAALAPSGHNAQPWKVGIAEPGRWVVEPDPERRLPQVDPKNRELLLSLGAFIENLVLAAGAMGREASVRHLPGPGPDSYKAEVTLNSASATGYPLERLELRRTIRTGYSNRELKSSDASALCSPLDGRLTYFPRSSEPASWIRESTVAAFTQQTWRNQAQEELCRWIRLKNREAHRLRDGLTPESMEMSWPIRWVARNFLTPESMMNKNSREAGIKSAAAQAAGGAGWLVLTSPGDDAVTLVETGRAFQRLFLSVREMGLALHPMTQMLEEAPYNQDVAATLGLAGIPQFILRVGYVEGYPRPVSLRRPPAWFVRG